MEREMKGILATQIVVNTASSQRGTYRHHASSLWCDYLFCDIWRLWNNTCIVCVYSLWSRSLEAVEAVSLLAMLQICCQHEYCNAFVLCVIEWRPRLCSHETTWIVCVINVNKNLLMTVIKYWKLWKVFYVKCKWGSEGICFYENSTPPISTSSVRGWVLG